MTDIYQHFPMPINTEFFTVRMKFLSACHSAISQAFDLADLHYARTRIYAYSNAHSCKTKKQKKQKGFTPYESYIYTLDAWEVSILAPETLGYD